MVSAQLPVGGTNLEFARSHNRRAVLEAVRRVGALSRAEIARETALTGQTISNIVGELERGGFLIAGEPRRGARGQPSVPYRINPQGAWSLGFHVDHRMITAALVDLTGETVAIATHPAHQPSPADAIAVLPQLARGLMDSAGVVVDRVLGAGLALPVRFSAGPITTAVLTPSPTPRARPARGSHRTAQHLRLTHVCSLADLRLPFGGAFAQRV